MAPAPRRARTPAGLAALPATSSPGLSFLLATVSAFGEDGWQDYWAEPRANEVQVADSWSDAYFVDFSGSQGHGPRPIVLSYASSPPAEVSGVDDQARARALLDTCFRQVEYVGVLAAAQYMYSDAERIDANREEWIQQWTEVVVG